MQNEPSTQVARAWHFATRRGIRRFFLINYALSLGLNLQFLSSISFNGVRSVMMGLAIWITYALIYLLPAMLITGALVGLLRLLPDRSAGGRRFGGLIGTVMVLCTSLTQLFLFADYQIYLNWGYHINGFVINLATTPGGIESLGASDSTYWTLIGLALGLVLVEACLGVFALRCRPWPRLESRWWMACGLLLLLSIAERINFGLAFLQAHQPTMSVVDAFPLYSKLTFKSLAKRLGIAYERRMDLGPTKFSGSFEYPKQALRVEPVASRPNIVWLVSESLRADSLNPEVMPNAWAFAQDNLRFENHYSGGNCTRMGVFSMFYGIYGSYWFPALDQRTGPVFFDLLLEAGYAIDANTSAKFTYPEFDKTVFVDLDQASMHQWNEGLAWECDRAHVDHLLEFIGEQDASQPFMSFSFFESPHARYYFPEDCEIRKPYLEDFNYATMSLEKDIELIRNRYLNSCYHLDQQLGRIFDQLKSQGLLENTIVIMTGDHGEEFMEHGRWGHGSTFVEEQIRVPLILHLPGQAPGVVSRATSHLDIIPTLLPLLGVNNAVQDYSQGFSLLGEHTAEFLVMADWSRLCLRTDNLKVVLPLKGKALMRHGLSTANDTAAPPGAAEALVPPMTQAMRELGRFRSGR